MRIAGLFIILLLPCMIGKAQEVKKDSAVTAKKDTVLRNDSIKFVGKKRVINIESYAKRFDPRKALFYAAILPGAGQAYNKKYWKIPLVYGGFWGLIAVVKFYNDAQVKYTNQLFNSINDPNGLAYPGTGSITKNSELTPKLRTIVDQARRQRDYFAILTGFFYILQMVDAHVDAHLKEFDLNPKLHVRIEPSIGAGQSLGMGINIRF